ncbi:MAG: hypothetical protein LBH69_00855 [Methanomassiliicoccaceae archaeon]|jgi:predicted thioesterase|nr:hypothetical protein [Methanomassiliicoccaceae archaeon]
MTEMIGRIHVNMATLMTIAREAGPIEGGIAIFGAGKVIVTENEKGFGFTAEDADGKHSGRLRFTEDGRDIEGFRCTCAVGKDGDCMCRHIVAAELKVQNELPDTRIELGKEGEAEMVVTDEYTARAMVGGNLNVLSTPALTMLMERAALAAAEGSREEGEATIGMSVSVEHLAAATLGTKVRAVARIAAVRGRKVTFDVLADDGRREIGKGTVVFMYIDEKRFLGKLLRGACDMPVSFPGIVPAPRK